MKKFLICLSLWVVSHQVPGQATFFISQFLTNNSVVVEVNPLAGDDRGGIAISTNTVLYTGDSSTVKLDASLGNQIALNTNLNALFSDLKTGQIYHFVSNDTLVVGNEGVITGFVEIDSATGLPIPGSTVTLSQPLSYTPAGDDEGIFSGYGQVLFYNLANVFRIQLPSGAVTDLGALALENINAQSSENWAFWGIAERIAGKDFLVYASGDNIRIVRTMVDNSVTGSVTVFEDLGDLASFTVAPWNQRWYFHHELTSQFTGTNNFAEVVGSADASIVTSLKGDLNGDSILDLILTKGKKVSALLLKGANIVPEEITLNLGKKDGKIVASADFNGDGVADLITQKGKTIKFLPVATNSLGAAVTLKDDNKLGKVVAVGDFTGDSQADIVLQKRKKVSLLTIKGGQVTSDQTLIEKINGKVVAAGDFNQDGDVDLLTSKGKVVNIYLMQGTTNTIVGAITTLNKTGKIIGAGYLTPDTKTDVILQKKGEVLAWEMDGSFIKNTLTISTDAKGFKVIGPR